MSRDAALEQYFAEGATWDADTRAQSRRSMKLALGVAGAGWITALGLTGALVVLMPLKRLEPYVIRVDNTSGVVDVVPAYAGHASASETVTRYLLNHYVTVCERFNFGTAESDYEECGAFHTAQRNATWYALWNPNNPASPLNAFKDGSGVRAQVTSISFFERGSGVSDLAQVRYIKAKRAAGSTQEEVTHWIATVQYAYTDPSTTPRMRAWNPLGFKIMEFKAEPEVLNEAPASAVALASTGSTKAAAAQVTP